MSNIRVSENIIPVSEFKTHTAEWLKRLRETSEPLIITQNGKAAGVMLSPAEYDRLTEHNEFVAATRQGLQDVESGRITPHQNVVHELRNRYKTSDDE
ncbi:type II toxin-antitoxin system Phd/YefM family antitoxin [Myxococcota bacterium]|nr:type II toxin-antitoxin system Phd/YefM family antitoxin [Myxococcota bacterium]